MNDQDLLKKMTEATGAYVKGKITAKECSTRMTSSLNAYKEQLNVDCKQRDPIDTSEKAEGTVNVELFDAINKTAGTVDHGRTITRLVDTMERRRQTAYYIVRGEGFPEEKSAAIEYYKNLNNELKELLNL